MGGLGTLAASALITAALPTAGLAPAIPSADMCSWRQSAIRLYQELAGEPGSRTRELRTLLAASGVGEPDFLGEQCRGLSGRPGPDETSGNGRSGPAGVWDDEPGSTDDGQTAGSGSGSLSTEPNADDGTTAAERYGWGKPNRVDEFDSAASAENWSIYDGPGHAGNGRRTPDAVSIADGVLTITGDSAGNTAGMAWNPGQKYGRWEGRVRAPASDETYNALLLLWPDAENFPVGGEVDFMEMMDHTRQKTELFLHYGEDNAQVHGEVEIDATEWHNWAVEWTPEKITAFVDGEEWWSTTDTSILPPGPMHLCIQLDWFPDSGHSGSVTPSAMHVDWVKQYPLEEGEDSSTTGEGSAGSTAADSSRTITDEINNGRRPNNATGSNSDGEADDSDSRDSSSSSDDSASSDS